MNRYCLIVITTLMLVGSIITPVFCQQDSRLDSLSNKIQHYYKLYPQEKIFINTSAAQLAPGDTLWYSATTMAFGKPSPFSKIIYVVLTDDAGNIIKQNKHFLGSGHANGDIAIPITLAPGRYQLQAYTAWSLNFPENAAWHEDIFIGTTASALRLAAGKGMQDYKIEFFPEGGRLIKGDISTIAYKATNEGGDPVKILGTIYSENKVLGSFSSDSGMGKVSVEITDDFYYALVDFPGRKQVRVDLPKVSKEGINVQVNHPGKEKIGLKIFKNRGSLEDVFIVAMQQNGISAVSKVNIRSGQTLVDISVHDFKPGITRISILNNQLKPVSERYVFIAADSDILLDKNISVQPERVTVINSKDKPAINISGSVSADMSNPQPVNIVARFLITSELKECIADPNSLFVNQSDSLKNKIDLVMLTNKWTFFNWDKILSETNPKLKYGFEKSQFAIGKVLNYNAKTPADMLLMLTDRNSKKTFMNITPDSTGTFLLNDADLLGGATIIIKGTNRKKNTVDIAAQFNYSIIDSFDIALHKNLTPPVRPARNLIKDSTMLAKTPVTQMLKNVVINATSLTVTEERILDHVKNLRADNPTTLDLVDVSLPTMNIFDYMRGRIPGMQILITNSGNKKFFYRGVSSLPGIREKPQDKTWNEPVFYIDEQRVDLEDVETLSLLDVALIQFAPPPVWFAPLGGGVSGAILIYTRNIKDRNYRKPFTKNKIYTIQGFSVTNNFNPQTGSSIDSRKPLMWCPEIPNDEYGNKILKFQRPHNSAALRVTFNGMDTQGGLFAVEKVIVK